METNYERIFSVATGNALTLPAGEKNFCWRLDFPASADITKLIVVQAAADPAQIGFSVNLYNRQVCPIAAGGSSSSSSWSGQAASSVTAVLAKVLATLNAAASAVVEMFNDHGWMFRNMEGTLTLPSRYIYVEIIVNATQATDTTWELALGARPKI